METLKTPFLSPFAPPPQNPFLPPPKPRPKTLAIPAFRAAAQSSDPWTLSDGNKRFKPKPQRKKPLSDDDARRIINAKAQYLSRLRRNQGSHAQTPRWIRRTPEQMARYIEDDRDGHLYGKHVVAAIQAVRGLAGRQEGSYDMRQVMGSFVAKLTFREMCIVLKEQRGWRQVRDFFAWMKLQLCYRPSVIVYTIILRLYGQVGKIKLAEQTFLEMLEAGCEPDEVACGTMLCSYARWGRHKDMMLFYESVQRREVLLPVAVYNFMLSSLQKKKQHGKVVQLWKQMLDAGAEPNHFTYTVVICSYAKGELVEEALEAFGKMRKFRFIPEEATYSLLISLIAKHGKRDEALRLYQDMRSQGIIPSNYTCASLLTLHYKNGAYSKALSLFSEMERHKIAPDEVIYGILVRIYGKLGLYDDAERTFEEVEKLGLLKDEKTYVAIAQVYLNAGNTEKALKVFDLMRSRNVKLSTFAYSALLRCFAAKEDVGSAEITFQTLSNSGSPDAVSCRELLILYVKLGLMEKAKTFIAGIRKQPLQFDEELYRMVLQVYCKEGLVDDAEDLLEEMENNGFSIDKYTKTSLIAMYRETGGLQKAEDLFETLVQPDIAALSVMLCLYLGNGDTRSSRRILTFLMEKAGGLSITSQLISKFAREGDIVKAESLYGQLIELGFRTMDSAIASMIDFYGRRQQLRKAQEFFTAVLESNRVGKLVYCSMIDAYVKVGKIDDAIHLYEEMFEQGHFPDAVTISIIVNAMAKNGMHQEAERIIHDSFQSDAELDTVAYNTYIKAMLEAGKLHFASSIYDRMVSSGISPTIQTYNTMISVYGRGGKLDKAIEIFNTAQSLGVSIDEKAYTNMICCYGKAGKSQEASFLFGKMKGKGIRPGKISYNIMINVYATAGLYSEANDLFQAMQKDGHLPDSFTYLALVRAYIESQKYSEAEDVILSMQKEGISPSCSHFNLLIFAFTRAGSISDAERIYNDMKKAGLCPDAACCRNMLRAYMNCGLVDEGISFFELIDGSIKPDGFLLSAGVHLYEYVGKEFEAEKILDSMNTEGILFLRNLKVGTKANPV